MLTDSQRAQLERELKIAFGVANRGKAAELLRLLGNPPDLKAVPDRFWRSIGDPLLRDIEPLLVQAAVTSAENVGARTSRFTVRWEMVNLRASRWAERYTFELVKGITENSRRRLGNAVSRFIKEATSDLKTLGQSVGSIFGTERGQMIAITEATRASAQGEVALVEEIRASNPDVRVVEIWLTSNDELVCPICGPLHGKRKGAGWVKPPPAHPNCRCAVGTEFVSVGGAQ